MSKCTCVRMEFESHKDGCPLAPTPDVDKIARNVALELVGKSGSEKEAIVAQALTQVQAPLVAALKLCEDALNTPEMHHGRASQKHINAWKAVRAALTGTGEKR